MQLTKCFFTAAQLLALPSVDAMWTANRENIDKILDGEDETTVHDVPDEKVNDFLHPLFHRFGGQKLVQEVTYRLPGSPKRDYTKTAIDALKEVVNVLEVLPLAVVNVCLDFVFGPPIKELDLETRNGLGKTLLIQAVS